MPRKTKTPTKTQTFCSINMDDCLWLDADIAIQRLLEKTKFGAKLKKEPGDFSANLKKLFDFYKNEANARKFPRSAQRLNDLPAPLGTLLNLNAKEGFCAFFAAADNIKANFIAINQHFLQYKSLEGFTINGLSPEHQKLLSKVFKEHYRSFVDDFPASFFDKNIVLVSGSQRSNQQTDHRQANKAIDGTATSSSQLPFFNDFTAYFNEKKHRESHYDNFLLGDLFRETIDDEQLTFDGSYEAAPDLDPKKNTLLTDFIALDKNKILLLYAQMQRAAEKNPDTKITFKFYDHQADILAALQKFYHNNPNLIPQNVSLQLIQTNSSQNTPGIVKKYDAITGIGLANDDWQENCSNMIEKLAQQAREMPHDKKHSAKVRGELKRDLIHLTGTAPYIKKFCTLTTHSEKKALAKEIKKILKACPGDESLSDFFVPIAIRQRQKLNFFEAAQKKQLTRFKNKQTKELSAFKLTLSPKQTVELTDFTSSQRETLKAFKTDQSEALRSFEELQANELDNFNTAKNQELQSLIFDTLPAKEKAKLVNSIIASYPITEKADYFLAFPINLQIAINQRLPILIAQEAKKITGPAVKFRLPITRESSKDKQARLNQRIDAAELQKKRLELFQNQISMAIVEQHSQQKTALASADDKAAEQKIAHAFFQQKIIDCALAQVTSNPQLARFDPQGHAITEVTLKEPEDYTEILRALDKQGIHIPTGPRPLTAKAALEAIMGLDLNKLTDTTYCSLDTKGIPELQRAFNEWLITPSEDASSMPETELQAWQAKLKACEKLLKQSDENSSINSLQLETEMHMRLNARGFEQGLAIYAEDLRKAQHQAAKELNVIVRQHFQDALLESYQDDPVGINYVTLNEYLDNARSLMKEHCQAILFKAYKEHAPAAFKAILDKIASGAIKDHDFETTTATGEGLLRTDRRNATCVYYGATNGTAHDKKVGEMAFRAKYTSAYRLNADHNPELTPTASHRFEARVPSIALTNISHKDSVLDVKNKISTFSKEIRQQSGNYSGPMNYCLLTSLSNPLVSGAFNIAEYVFKSKPNYDEQRESASRILQGSHLFNKEQLLSDTPDALCFVQNIPVNQHGLALSHWSMLGVVNEATLMAELSLLSMLYQKITANPSKHSDSDKIIIRAYHDIKGQYVNFLQNNTCEKKYFYKSNEGRLANKYFVTLKAELKAVAAEAADVMSSEASPTEPNRKDLRYVENLISKALTTILAHNLHLDLRYGMLTQALSVFCHRASFYGCKSANERYMAVANRSELLDGIEIRLGAPGGMKNLSQQEKKFIAELEAFTNPSNAVDLHATRQSLNFAYDKHGLQAAAATISYEDQGAASKVKASAAKKSDGSLGAKEIDTNVAEVDLSKMASKHAGDNQAHKAHLVKRAVKALSEPEFLSDYNEALRKAGKPPVEGLSHANHSMHGLSDEQLLDPDAGEKIRLLNGRGSPTLVSDGNI